MKLKLLGLLLVAGATVTSCKKSDVAETNIVTGPISEIKAPAGFTWSGSRDVSMSLGITDNSAGNQIHTIKIYTADPSQGGELISSGSATVITPFNTKFGLSSTIKEVYVEKISPSGAVIGKSIILTSNNVSAAISASTITPAISSNGIFGKQKLSVVNEPTPSVPGGATVIASSGSTYNLPSGTYVIKSNTTASFNPFGQNSVVYVDGTNINIGAINFANNLTVIVTANSVVKFGSSFNWTTAATFKNFGTVEEINTSVSVTGGVFRNQGSLKIKGSLGITETASPTKLYNTGSLEITSSSDFRGLFENSGTVLLNGSQNFKAGSDFRNEASGSVTVQGANYSDFGGKFENAGTFTIDGAGLNMDKEDAPTTFINTGTFNAPNAKLILKGSYTNSGTVTVNEIAVNSGGKIYNNCKWFVTKTDQWINTIDGLIENSAYFSISGGMQVNSNGTIRLKNGSLFVTNWVSTLNTVVEAPLNGSTSVFKINNSFVNPGNYNSVKFNGPIQVVSAAQLPAVFFANGAQRKATSAETVTISAGSCMAEGSGPVVNTDPDGDSVHGAADLYPNDPNKAYNSFSENYVNGGATVAFEDNWPVKGDYDLNDVVINYKYKVITNGQNKVVRVEAAYKLLASGGEFKIGAGIEFPLAAAKATNFSGPAGTSLESGQDKVVVILFQNSRDEQPTWNTQPGQSVSPAKDYVIAFDVVDGPHISDFVVNVFNPFIFNMSFGRKYETHLFGKTPTTLALTAPFGTGDDRTSGTKYYATEENLPWAIHVPIANFQYPVERASIADAYKMFGTWAESGGIQAVQWYNLQGPANRDDSKIYGSN